MAWTETTSFYSTEAIKARRPPILVMHYLIGETTRSEKPVSENNLSYKADLLGRLRDLQYAQLYLDAAAKESQETFLLALRDVAEAQKGMSQLAEEADVNRENLYRALSEDGNPRLSTLGSVLDALGMEWGITLKHPHHDAGAKK
jgi:probable addiction module antidote protein